MNWWLNRFRVISREQRTGANERRHFIFIRVHATLFITVGPSFHQAVGISASAHPHAANAVEYTTLLSLDSVTLSRSVRQSVRPN